MAGLKLRLVLKINVEVHENALSEIHCASAVLLVDKLRLHFTFLA
jgi:hypothetical protein